MSNENLKKVYQTVLKDFPEHKNTFGDYEFFQEKMKDPENAEKLRKLLRTKYNRETLGDSAEFSNKVKISENDIEKTEEIIHQNITNKPAEKILAEEILNINNNQTQILDQNTTEQNNFKKINPIQESIEKDVDSQINLKTQNAIELGESPLGITLDSLIKDIDLNSDIFKPDQQKFTGESVDQSAFPQEFEDNILEKAVKDTAGDIAGAIEIPITMATSLIGFGASGIYGAIERAFSGEMDDEKLVEMMGKIQNNITYEPKTEFGQEGLQIISYPFEKFVEATDKLGEIVYDYTGSPVLATAAKTVSEGSLYLYGPVRAKYKQYKAANKNKNAVAINDIAEAKMQKNRMRDLIYDDVIVNNMSLDAIMKKYNIPKNKKPMAGLLVKEIKDSWAAKLKEIPYEIVTEGNVVNVLKQKPNINLENIKEVKIITKPNNQNVVQVIGKNNKVLDGEVFPTLEAAKSSANHFMVSAALESKKVTKKVSKPTQSYYDEKLDKIVEVKDKESVPVIDDLKLSAEDKKKLKDTKVSDESGAIKVFHGTPENFDSFDLNKSQDIGIHLGSKEQAKRRLKRADTNEYPEGSNIRGHYINIKNPLYLEDLNNWYPDEISLALKEQGFKNVPEFGVSDKSPKHYKELRDYLKNKGYDGIIYRNEFEGKDPRNSLEIKDRENFDDTFLDFADTKAMSPKERIDWLMNLEKDVKYNKGELVDLSYIVFDPKKQIFGYETTLKKPLKIEKIIEKPKKVEDKKPKIKKQIEEKVVAETLPDKLVVLNNTISSLQKKKELGPLDDKDKKKLGQLVILRTRVQNKIRETKKELLDKETELKETTGFFNKKQESIDFQLSSLKAKQKKGKITPSEKIDIRRLEKEKKDLIQEQKNYEIEVKKDVVARLSKTKTELEKQIRFASRKGSQSTPLERKELNRKISKVHKLISRLENEKGVSIASEVYGQTYSTIIPPGLIHVFKIIERKLKARGSKPFTDADIEHIDYIINQSGDILPNDFDINNKYYVQETGHNAFLTKVRKRKLEIAKSNKEVMKWNEKVPDELDRADIGAYVEGIGNILIENDTFADVKKRMTSKKLEVYNQYKRSIEKARVDINSYLKEFAGANQDYIGFLENYLPHFYVDVDGKGYQFAIDKLKSSKNAQKRKLPTLQEALDAGLSPKSQDPGVLYNLYTTLNWTMATNKMFSHDLHKIITPEGNRAVIPNYKNVEHPSDYIYYNHPILNKAYSMPNKKGEFKESHNGVWVHPQLKAPLDMLKKYNQFGMLPDETSKFWETYDMFNNSAKSLSLSLSLFHNIALFESAQSVFMNKNPIRGVFLFGDKSPLTSKRQFKLTHRAGLDLIKDDKYFEDMLMAGLEISHPSMDNHKGTWEKIRDGLSDNVGYYTGSKKANNLIKKVFDKTIIKHQDLLWNHYHSGLKAYAYVDIVEKSKNLFPELSLTEIKEITANNVNNAFGGQEWESKLILGNPEILKWTRRGLLSPDWTYSSAAMGAGGINSIYKKASGGKDLLGEKSRFKGDKYTRYQSKFYTNYWKNMALTLGGTALLSQYAIYQAFGDEELDEPLTYNNEKGKRWEIDITPMLRHFSNKKNPGSWTTKQRYYTSLGKQAKELFGYIDGIYGPRNTLLRKSSPMFQFGYEAFVGETISGFSSDWARDNANTYDLITSAMGRIVKSYMPFSLQGNSLGFALPISKGKTPFKAEKEMAEIMHAYVDPGIVQRIKNKYTSDQISTLFGVQKFDPFVYEEKFTEFFPEIIKALERNGYNSESVLKNVVGGLATQYNRELISIGLDKDGNWRNPEELSEKDKFLMEYAAYKLFKLNKNASNFAKSLKGKLKSGKLQGYDTDYFNKYRQIWQDAYNVLPDPQNDPEKWLRNALKNDYFTKYQKDIVNLARLKVEASILKDKLINN
jgi:hypothetical protein